VRSQPLFVSLVAGLVVLAWVALWLLERSPDGRLLGAGHTSGGERTTAGFICIIGDSGTRHPNAVLLFVGGWMLMSAAMMLPTSLPLIAFFHAFVRKRPNRSTLVGLLVAGYLLVWVAFAVLVHLGDLGVQAVAGHAAWLDGNAWIVAAAIFALAGLYQFSKLKYQCLDKCRSPVNFVMQHWRGGPERRQSLRLGVHHGIFCLGCCWSLMLLMFAVSVGSLGWMLALAAVMAAEKNAPWGRRLSAPVGALLVLGAAAITVAGLAGGGLPLVRG
jgi:predicted metal-binding membrane protein